HADFASTDAKHLRKGQAAAVSINSRKIGTVGRLSDEVAARFKFKQPVYVGEIDFSAVLGSESLPATYVPLGKYPAIVRDVSFLVQRDVSSAQIKKAIETKGFELCQKISFVDIYEGKGLGADERSLTVRLEYRSTDKTLTEAEVDQIHTKILKDLESTLGIRPRF
ncbi:MAG: hypothetical protein LC730_05425, partial [Acidobacteria bacterium]|nr:hypothetical protein [Acidobacteriota bacterium]MCA1608883.1 hypothetical protein [Acidobacteriota bacterium]